MKTTITRLRDARSPIAVAFSTKDRVALTRRTVSRLLDHDGIDLHWFDGSATPEGRALPAELMPGHAAATAVYEGVVGGPDSAILYALLTLRTAGYAWVVLLENDVLLDDGWLEALQAAVEAAERDGFRVGGVSCRVIADRVLSFNTTYSLLFNAGAGFIALTQEALDHVVRNYRTLDASEAVRRFRDLTDVDVSRWWSGCGNGVINLLLSADWMYDVALYANGLVVAAPPVTVARNIDPGNESRYVETVADHPEGARGALTHGRRLRSLTRPEIRFQPLRSSDRVIVGCHHLRLGALESGRAGPVTLAGAWSRRWLQFLGPFELFGTGSVTVELFDAPLTLLVHAREGKAILEVTAASGTTQRLEIDPPCAPLPLTEVVLDPFGQRRGTVTVAVRSGAIGLIGLCMQPDLTPYFANATPELGFLAF